MNARTLTETSAVPTALAAFLRGIERRGAIFAELQCGDPICGDAALAATLRAFRDGALREGARKAGAVWEGAADVPITEWPHRFWALLLVAPSLRRPAPDARWPQPFAALSTLGSGPRAALLLRLVAGLEDTDAAEALRIARPTYRLALRRALPHLPTGTPDAAAWHALVEASQQAVRQLPPARLARIAQLREAALQQRQPVASRRRRPPAASAQSRWLPTWLWTGLVACMLAFAASFLLPSLFQRDGEPRIRRTALPAAESPASTFDARTALLTDPDFELLQATDAEVVAPRDVGFQSWYAAQLAVAADADAATPIADARIPAMDLAGLADASATSGLESVDAPR